MLIQKKVSVGGAFARKKAYDYEGKKFEADVKNGDVIKVLSSGDMVPNSFDPTKEQYVFKINTRNGEKNTNFNQTTLNTLVDAYGANTEAWVGKDVVAHIIKMSVQGKFVDVLFFAPQGWEINDEGKFYNPSQAGDDNTPSVDYPDEDINPEEIPF